MLAVDPAGNLRFQPGPCVARCVIRAGCSWARLWGAGTGKAGGDRHPKIHNNVLIGASATVLGNIIVGKGAQVAAGSMVLKDVPPRTMVAGSPAKVVGCVQGGLPPPPPPPPSLRGLLPQHMVLEEGQWPLPSELAACGAHHGAQGCAPTPPPPPP